MSSSIELPGPVDDRPNAKGVQDGRYRIHPVLVEYTLPIGAKLTLQLVTVFAETHGAHHHARRVLVAAIVHCEVVVVTVTVVVIVTPVGGGGG